MNARTAPPGATMLSPAAPVALTAEAEAEVPDLEEVLATAILAVAED